MRINQLTQTEKKEWLIRFFADMITVIEGAKYIGEYTINIAASPWGCEDHRYYEDDRDRYCEDDSVPKEVNYKMDLELTRGIK